MEHNWCPWEFKQIIGRLDFLKDPAQDLKYGCRKMNVHLESISLIKIAVMFVLTCFHVFVYESN